MLSILAALVLTQTSTLDAPTLAKASRQDKGGWIILHLKGTPREIGYQHGVLVSTEIADAVKTGAAFLKVRSGKDWSWYRAVAKNLFWPKMDEEYRQEIDGIAEGLRAKGGKEDSDDILALNSFIELSDYYVPKVESMGHNASLRSAAPLSCSAFVATGSETKDGKIVMGQNFWWDYVMGERWRVILDITPVKGNRMMFDALPGLIESGTDWAINDKGIALTESTLSNFVGFDEAGAPEFERMRKAIQYADSLDETVRILKEHNNGAYANRWLLADIKTNTIGDLELGLKNVVFRSTSDGCYSAANYPQDPKLMREEAPGYDPKSDPCELRRARWETHLVQDKGKVDATLAMSYVADSYNHETGKNDGGGGALCGKQPLFGAISARVLTSDSVSKMGFWAKLGVPDGTDVVAADLTQGPFWSRFKPYLRDLKAQPWTMILAGDLEPISQAQISR